MKRAHSNYWKKQPIRTLPAFYVLAEHWKSAKICRLEHSLEFGRATKQSLLIQRTEILQRS